MTLSFSSCSLFLRYFLNGDSRIWTWMRVKIFRSKVEITIMIFLLFLTTPGLVSGLQMCLDFVFVLRFCCFYVHHTSQSLGSFPLSPSYRWEWPCFCVLSWAFPWALCSHCWLRPGGLYVEHPQVPKCDKVWFSSSPLAQLPSHPGHSSSNP